MEHEREIFVGGSDDGSEDVYYLFWSQLHNLSCEIYNPYELLFLSQPLLG